jgi:dihydroxyacetone kinase
VPSGSDVRKLLNDPQRFVDDYLDGMLLAHAGTLARATGHARAVVRVDPPGAADTVAIVTGGGSGHLPVFVGYVGQGLCAGAAVGNTFSSPSVEAIVATSEAVARGRGVLYLYGNYGGDNLNFDDAADELAARGVETVTVRASDDVASAPASAWRRRRGVAGMVFAYKCAGAAAAAGRSLAETGEIAERALAATRTMGVGLSPTILPEAGLPTFELGEGELEIGIGIHGEPGVRRGPMRTADESADELHDSGLAELDAAGGRLAVLVNSLGATPVEECYVLYRRVAARLGELGATVHRALVGRYATSLEMAGCSLSVMVLDDELASLLDAPCDAPMLRLLP